MYLKAYGVRDKEKNLPLTPDSVMTSASLSKSAFATVVMQLVEEGVLNLDKPVYQYLPKPLPDYPFYRDLANDPRYKQITLRMLLDHTSGFPNWRAFNDDHKLNINFTPGSRFAYSGEGILLAQLVVETVTKKPINDVMRQHLFGPDDMTRTSMVWESRFESDYANGYDEYGRSLGPERPHDRRCRRLHADHLARLRELSAGIAARSRHENRYARADAESANPDSLQARISLAGHRNHHREQIDPPELRSGMGTVLDSVWQSLFQRGT